VYLLLLTGAPLLDGLWLSLTDTQLLNPTEGAFIGIHNYSSLFSDAEFAHALVVTIVYSTATVLGSLIVGTVAAVAMNGAFRGTGPRPCHPHLPVGGAVGRGSPDLLLDL